MTTNPSYRSTKRKRHEVTTSVEFNRRHDKAKLSRLAMKEYAMDITVNLADHEEDINGDCWFPNVDECLVAARLIIETYPKAESFVFNIVQRDHTS